MPETGRIRIGTQARFSRTTTWAAGGILAALGVLGFVPGVTTNYDELQVGGYESLAMLFGIFQVSIALNIIHLAIGGAGMLMALNGITARPYLFVSGLVLAVLAAYGAAIDRGTPANVLPVNLADVWLHGVLAVALLTSAAAVTARERGDPTAK